jgi:hypothetical protein
MDYGIMAKELKPGQDLKINAGLMRMWKKAGLRVKGFKATKKGHNEIWSGEFKTKNAILQMSVDKYGSVFYHAGNKSVNIGRLDKQRKIIDWMKAIIRNSPWAESVNERKLSSHQKKAILIAIEMSGDMTGATKKIEKIKRGLSKDKKVKDALRLANESVNEGNLPSNIQKWIKDRGPKPSKDVKMIGKWVKKLTGREISGGVAIGKNYNTLVLDIEHEDAAIHYDTTSGDIKLYNKKIRNFNGFKKVFQANESVNERIERNEVHAETKKELKDAIARSMKEILKGKTPKYDIINGMTGEMIGWKDGKDYIWQPNAIPYAERELK